MGYRRRTWLAIDRQKAGYRKTMRPVFMKALEDQIAPLYAVINQATNITHVEVPQLSDEAIRTAYKRLYFSTAADFARQDRRASKSRAGIEILKNEEQMMDDIIARKIEEYLATEIGTTITAIGDTSEVLLKRLLDDLIPEIIDQGIGGGAAQTMLRDQIKSQWHKARYFRTERIVRTEVNRAANWGSLEGVKSTEFPHDKVWMSSFAATSRAGHMAADNQKVDINEMFDIDGEDLQYPGDPGGSASNTINCLCSLTYEIK